MRRSTGRRRSVALVAVVMTTIGATACGDSQSVPRERLFAPNRGTTYDLTSLGDSAWNHYSADVTLQISGGGRIGSRALPDRTVAYHTEKTMEPGGTWKTVLTVSAQTPLPPNQPNGLGQIVFSEAAGSLQFFDAQGKSVPASSVSGLPSSAIAKLPSAIVPSAPGKIHRAADPRAWIDNVVLSAAARDRQRRGIQKAFGQAAAHGQGRDTYRLVRGRQQLEIVADADRGVVLEQTITTNGKQTVHVANTFTEPTPGVYVRSSSRIERAGDDKTRASTVTETIANVRLDRIGGQD